MKIYEVCTHLEGYKKYLFLLKIRSESFKRYKWISATSREEAIKKYQERTVIYKPFKIGEFISCDYSFKHMKIETIDIYTHEVKNYTFDDIKTELHADDFIEYCQYNCLEVKRKNE